MSLVVIEEDRLIEIIDTVVSNAVERVTKIYEKEAEKDKLMSLQELQEYLPNKPAKQTIYGWVYNRKIPFVKIGKPLYFRKSEIDEWISNGKMINQ